MRQSQLDRYHQMLLGDERALKYCMKRGLTYDVIESFHLGWCPPEDSFDVFRGRLLFPVFDVFGAPVTVQGRIVINPDNEKWPKYLHGSAAKGYEKNHHLFGFGLALATMDKLRDRRVGYLFEGPVDVCLAWKMGKVAVASFGTSFSLHQAMLCAYLSPFWFVATDDDLAGRAAAGNHIDRLKSVGAKKVRRFTFGRKDLGEVFDHEGFAGAKDTFDGTEEYKLANLGWRTDNAHKAMDYRT